MPGVTVQLLSFDKQARVAEVKSDASGRFVITPPRAGTYILRANEEHIGSITVEIRFDRKGASKKSERDYIHFLLDLDPKKYCSGSSVDVVRENPRPGPNPAR